MSEILHKLSWERFCEKDNINDSDKSADRLVNQYSSLLDMRNINIKQIGPVLKELPENCLNIIMERLNAFLSDANNNRSVLNALAIIKVLSVISRNNNNLSALVDSNVVSSVLRVTDLVITKLSKEIDNEWFNLFEYLLYFLESVHDPTFSWRRRKKRFYSESAELEIINQSVASITVSNETVTWLCTQLSNFFGDRDIRNRLLHFFCAIISSNKENSQIIVSPASVDVFDFSGDGNAEIIVSFCCMISGLSQVDVSERQEELSLVVRKLLQYMLDRPDIRILELRCIYQLVSVSSELGKEILKAGVFTIIRMCLVNSEQDQEQCRLCFLILTGLTVASSNCKTYFQSVKGYDKLLEYLCESKAQSAFLLDLVFSWAVCDTFDASKVSSYPYVISDGGVIGLLVRWGTQLAILYNQDNKKIDNSNSEFKIPQPVVNWKAIFKLIVELCRKTRCSINECCDSGIIAILCNCVKDACKSMDDSVPEVIDYDDEEFHQNILSLQSLAEELVNGLLYLLQLFSNYSLNGLDVTSMILLFKDKHTKTRGRRMIKILNSIISENNVYSDINCWFELFQPGHCICVVTPVDDFDPCIKQGFGSSMFDRRLSQHKILDELNLKISNSYFSFVCWINVSPLSILEKVDAGHERASIFRLLTETNNGFEIFLNMDSQLLVATCHQGEFHYVQITGKQYVRKGLYGIDESFLKPGKWHMLAFVFQNMKNFFTRSSLSTYLDGTLISTVELKYPQMNDAIKVFHIGGCPKNCQMNNIGFLEQKSRKRLGFLSNSGFKKTWLGEEHNTWGRISTLKCRIVSVTCLNDILSESMVATLYSKGPMNTQTIYGDENLISNIIINFHASAFDPATNECFNLHPTIQSSRRNKYHSGHLYGRLLRSNKFENVVNEVGGICCLLPIVEQLEFMELRDDDINNNEGFQFDELHQSNHQLDRYISTNSDDEKFISIPDSTTDNKINESILASVVILVRRLSVFNDNQSQLERCRFIPILGALMQKVEPILLDINVVLAFRAFADLCNEYLTSQIYQFILLDWRIWSRCSAETRKQHMTFIKDAVKHERSKFRTQYGTTFFLDVIRFYHSPNTISNVDVHAQLREDLFWIIYYLNHKHISVQDYQKILKFIHECNSDSLIEEAIQLLSRLHDDSNAGDQDTLLLYESHLMESLFVLLVRNISIKTKEEVIKFLYSLIVSNRIQDKYKNHLLLNDISFASIFVYKEFYQSPLSPESVQHLLNIIKKAASKDLFGVIQFLSLLTLSPIEQRLQAIKMLKSFFDKSPDAIFAISQQSGWQDILIHLLVLRKREDVTNQIPINDANNRSEEVTTKSRDPQIFKRSSIWLFDESFNEPTLNGRLKFGEVVEEDDDEFSVVDPALEKDVLENNFDAKSVETFHLKQCSCETNDENQLNLSTAHFQRHSVGGSIASDETSQINRCMSIIMDLEGKDLTESNDICQEQLIDIVLECLHRVIWSVLSASTNSTSWMVVHQVIESLTSINDRYILLKSMFFFKQKIFIRLLDAVIVAARMNESQLTQVTMHTKELVQLIVDSSCQNVVQFSDEYDTELLEKVIILLQDCFSVWEEEVAWPELAGLGFYYLLNLCSNNNIKIVAAVSARLHQIIMGLSKGMNYEEIAFIIVYLDRILKSMTNNENYYFMAPILKTILEHYIDILHIQNHLPNLSIRTAEFYDYFKIYCKDEEWRSFIKLRLISASEIYEGSFLNSMTTSQSLWRAQANEQMSKDRKMRHSVSSEHQKKFENIIVNMTLKWIKEERRRKHSRIKDLQFQHEACLRHWRILKHSLTGSKGCWKDNAEAWKIFWKQSCRETFLRMRPRFDPNYQYTDHADASKERDFPSLPKQKDFEPDPFLCLSALEGKIDFKALGDDQLGDDEWITVQNSSSIEPNISVVQESPSISFNQRKSIFETRCKLITLNEIVDGRFELKSTHFSFSGQTASCDIMDTNSPQIVCSINQIREVHLRRYNLRRSAIEIFLTDQTNYFFNFDTKIRNKVYSKILSLRPPNIIYSKQRSPADLLKSCNLTQKWVNREISNFEYLMQLNTIAGRTYNDMSQYPVFPWIIANYTSPKLDLNDPKTFRDLSKPIGVVNPKNENQVREKYENFEDPTGVIQKFHYGTHYSSAAGVMHYLVRMEPFTTMHIQLQSGKFDVADRQFHSIPLAWNFIMESPNDNKELIPEFFYLPNFLRNENNFDFGQLQQTGTRIDDVELPAWASSPEDFIFQHRKALESEYVSQNLHNWIDLIFGYKQKGKHAIEALNVFYYVTYEGVVDLDQIQDKFERESIESMINNFGQTPCQLLKIPHPKRLSESDAIIQSIRSTNMLPIISNLSHLRHSSKCISNESEPIVFIRLPTVQSKGLIGADRSQSIITVHASNIVAKHVWSVLTKTPSITFQIDNDPVFDSPISRRKNHLGPVSSLITINNQLYAISPDGKFVIAGGNVDNRLVIMQLPRKSDVSYVPTPHHAPISCVAIDTDSAAVTSNANVPIGTVGGATMVGIRMYGITGSLDSSCVVWDWTDLPSASVVQLLCGHSKPVTSVSLSVYLDVAVTGSLDGTVCIHSVLRGQFLNCIIPGGLNSSTLAVNFVVLSRLAYIYIQWQNEATTQTVTTVKGSPFSTSTLPKQYVSIYSLHSNHISTLELGHSKVTTCTVMPKNPGSLESVILLGNVKGELLFLDGYYLLEYNTLRFKHSILDAQLHSSNGQYLIVALSDGSIIVSTVSS